jgi:hypothetical protein
MTEPIAAQDTVKFFRAYPNAISPMRADKAALGVMPTMAYRHCEPMRTASSFGWYIFPPEDIWLKWNGADILYKNGDDWEQLKPTNLPGFVDYWNEHAPEELHDMPPPFISPLPVRGIVQVWSGLLCATKPDWSVLVRPVVNIKSSNMYTCFEGLVEADRFQPFPLFVNMQLHATDVPIQILKVSPLFQVQPLLRGTYGDEAHTFSERVGLGEQDDGLPAMAAHDWVGYRNTIRLEIPDEPSEPGRYTKATRKRTKHEEPGGDN